MRKFVIAADVRKKILEFCSDYWYEFIDKELTDEITVVYAGVKNLDCTVLKLARHLTQRAHREFRAGGKHSATGMLYQAASQAPDLLTYVVKRRFAATLETNDAFSFKLYGLRL